MWESCRDREFNTGDTAWMLFATTFVMLQTPATGICQAGLVRRKNCVSVLAQTMLGVAIGAVLWFLFGFSLTFGPSNGGVIGTFKYALLREVNIHDCFVNAPTIPAIMFVSYQMMFALMCPVLVTGAWAERMHFNAFVMFTVLWPILVYYPIAHAFWNVDGYFNKWGVLDFAGGLVIHATSGVAALVVSIMIEKRRHHDKLQGTVHNIPLMVIGGALIWAGWYSFNGGSALAANFQAVNALMATQLSASVGAITWSILSAITLKKVPCANIVSGALSGLAGITAASGFVSAGAAVCAGIAAGVSSFFAARFIRTKLRIDDVLDVTALQAVPGISGAIVVAFAADSSYVPGAHRLSKHEGLLVGGSPILLYKQLCAVLVTCVWTAVATLALFIVMDRTVGINITAEDEEQGLDKTDHGESAYDDDHVVVLEDKDTLGTKLCNAAAVGDMVEMAKLLRSGGNPLATDYEGRTPMHAAASAGQVRIMEWLHQVHGVGVDVRDAWGNAPMQEAIKSRQDDVIAWLQAQGAVIEPEDMIELLCIAASNGDVSQLETLLGSVVATPNVHDYDSRTPLHIAASKGHEESVKALLSFGADSKLKDRFGLTPLDDARQANHEQVVALLEQTVGGPKLPLERRDSRPLLSKQQSRPEMMIPLLSPTSSSSSSSSLRMTTSTTELCSAAARGDLAEMKRLLRKGADPNLGDYNKRTPLHIAASNGHLDVVKFLCELRGINVNCQDRYQSTPLMDAINKNKNGILTVLKRHGATTADKAHGYRLCRAAAEGNIQMLKKMAEMGTNLNNTDYDGRTALHLAASSGHLRVVEWLISQGVDLTVTDRWNSTPLQDAIRHEHKEIGELLRKAGAQEVTNEHSLDNL
eukprot:c11819_g1_i1.p1 GENE.c11819_g1_i1~~c11819_g1_i1.p1  ORF type:complete len:870 (-),score=227.03 c11819_g1_i1:956-3565(-)